MPREQINYVDLESYPRGIPMSQDDACVEVTWLPKPNADTDEQGWVQVCLEVDVTYAAFAAEQPNGNRENRTQMFTPVLTRRDLNKMIRTLKRARDAAYGADE